MTLRLCNYVPSAPNEDEFFSKENIKRVSTSNTRPDATGLRETVVNNGPCPTKNHTKFDFIFQLFHMGCIVILGLFPFALTGLDFRIALLISLPIIAFGISKPVRWLASTHNGALCSAKRGPITGSSFIPYWWETSTTLIPRKKRTL